MRATLFSRRAVPFYLVLAVSLVMLFSPGSTVPAGPPYSDKVTHLLIFLVLALAARYAQWRAGWILLGGVLYAAVTEVLQFVLPIQRSGTVGDWLADVVGVAIGLGVVWLWRTRQSAATDGDVRKVSSTLDVN